MKQLRYFLLSLLALIFVVLAFAAHYYYKGFHKNHSTDFAFSNYSDEAEMAKINEKASLLKKFASEKNYNQKFIFLVDMSIPSGKNRFFVYDILKDSIIKSALVAHGSGDNRFSLHPTFSNQFESGCSSLGRYKIGNKYNGRFGPAYKLYGLDSSNSNAFRRNVVLHSYDCVPSQETYPYPICNSRGCAMVSPEFMKELQKIIDANEQPILLWMFN
ncbi:MAG TPA: murein L,D-transpeptidase catalytic domain family protein [Puia sp.]|nr:murein L,D-transpeptidase catalytic domain family protein [Puia sp.]